MLSNKIKLIIVLFVLLVFGSALYSEVKSKYIEDEASNKNVTDTEKSTEYYTYSDVENMVKFLGNTEDRERELVRLIDPLNKSQYVNVKYMYDICELTSVDSGFFCKSLEGRAMDSYVTKEEFDLIYDTIVCSKKINSVKRRSVYVYDIVQGDTDTIFDGSKYYPIAYKINERYIDKIIDVYLRGDTIYKVIGLSDDTYTLNNVLVESVENGSCVFLYEDVEKRLRLSNKDSDEPNGTLTNVHSETDGLHSATDATRGKEFIGSVCISNNGVDSVTPNAFICSDRVLDVSDNKIRISGKGTVSVSDDFRLYDIYDGAFCEKNSNIMLGHTSVDLYADGDGKVVAGVIKDDIVCDNIRVILSNNNYSSYDFTETELTCNEDYMVTFPSGETAEYKAGSAFYVNVDYYNIEDEIVVEPKTSHGVIMVNSLKRECGIPSYSGKMYIYIYQDKLNLVNEVPIERYLYSVVSDVMPQNAPPEAMRAMAICARGYAYTKIMDESYLAFNAHLDDSYVCQQYGNRYVTNKAIDAVKNTYGIVTTYQKSIVIPQSYNTSCGMMSSNGEFEDKESFPFYISAVENEKRDKLDISSETAFKQFIDTKRDDIIEANQPYYRWHVTFNEDKLSDIINDFLVKKQEALLESCCEIDEEGNVISDEFTDIGKVIEIKVAERTVSGVVKKVHIKGSKKTIEVSGVNVIRAMISPEKNDIIKNDDTILNSWNNLPSPYFYIEKSGQEFTVYGGGFGNGAGLSINGACCLANSGYNYKYILRYYFPYTDFMSIYDIQKVLEEEE